MAKRLNATVCKTVIYRRFKSGSVLQNLSYHTPKKERGEKSKLWEMASNNLTNDGTSRVAEAAVLLRATLKGLLVYGSLFDGDKADWVVEVPSGKTAKLQVKAVRVTKKGLPHIHLSCSEGHSGRRRYKAGEFDFIVGYDLYTDTAYVFSFAETEGNKTTITIAPEFAESWQKVLDF